MNVKKYLKYVILTICILCVCFTFIFFFKLYPLKYVAEIKQYSIEKNLSPHLIASIINTESSFNKNAQSDKGAIGLMQLLPTTAKWICEINKIDYAEENLFEPSFNIKIGTIYLKYLINKFENQNTAIVAYNAGEGVVSSWLNNTNYSTDQKTLTTIPYSESNSYLQKVNRGIGVYKVRINWYLKWF